MKKLLWSLLASILVLVGCLFYLAGRYQLEWKDFNIGNKMEDIRDQGTIADILDGKQRVIDAQGVKETLKNKSEQSLEPLPEHYLYYYDHMNGEDKQRYQELYSVIVQHGKSSRVSVMDIDTIERIFQYILLDNPELFYIENLEAETITIANIKSMMNIGTIENMEEDKQVSAQKAIEQFKAGFLGLISADMSEETKTEKAFSYVVEELEYVADSPYNQTLYSAALGETVCMGYTAAFKYLCDQVDIPCISVIGKLEGGDHAWNMVKLDHSWYQVDCTQGDALITYPPKVDYRWFKRSSEDMKKTHELKEPELLPVCR